MPIPRDKIYISSKNGLIQHTFSEYDVLLGHDSAAQNPGNLKIKSYIEATKEQYATSGNVKKSKLVQGLMNTVSQQNGKFLRLNPTSHNGSDVFTEQPSKKIRHQMTKMYRDAIDPPSKGTNYPSQNKPLTVSIAQGRQPTRTDHNVQQSSEVVKLPDEATKKAKRPKIGLPQNIGVSNKDDSSLSSLDSNLGNRKKKARSGSIGSWSSLPPAGKESDSFEGASIGSVRSSYDGGSLARTGKATFENLSVGSIGSSHAGSLAVARNHQEATFENLSIDSIGSSHAGSFGKTSNNAKSQQPQNSWGRR